MTADQENAYQKSIADMEACLKSRQEALTDSPETTAIKKQLDELEAPLKLQGGIFEAMLLYDTAADRLNLAIDRFTRAVEAKTQAARWHDKAATTRAEHMVRSEWSEDAFYAHYDLLQAAYMLFGSGLKSTERKTARTALREQMAKTLNELDVLIKAESEADAFYEANEFEGQFNFAAEMLADLK